MKSFLIRSSIIIVIILLQINFLNLIFPSSYTLNVIPLMVIAWVTVTKFEKIWIWILLLGAMTDIAEMEKFGKNILFFVVLAYLVSFLSKRFLIERRLYGTILLILFIITISFITNFNGILNFGNFSLDIIVDNIVNNLFAWKRLLTELVFGISVFYLMYNILNKIEMYLSKYDDKLLGNL